MKKLNSEKRFMIACLVIMIIVAIICVAPFILMFSASITDEDTLVAEGYRFFPSKVNLDSWRYMWIKRRTIGRAYLLSGFCAVVGTTVNVIMTSLFAYPLSRKDFKPRNAFAFFIFFTMLFNGGMTASYIIWSRYFHIKNTIWALLIPNYLMGGMNVLMVRNYYTSSIPTEIIEAARIDGASEMRIYRNILIPLSKPVIITIAIFAGMAYWNDWINAQYYITETKLYGINAYLNQLQNNIKMLSQQSDMLEGTELGNLDLPRVGARMAIALIAVLPVLVIFPFIQSEIIKGVVIGGVKG